MIGLGSDKKNLDYKGFESLRLINMRRKNVMDYVLQEKKETVASKLEAEKQKLGELELRLRDLLATTASRRSSEDSGTITWSDEDSGKTTDTVVRS